MKTPAISRTAVVALLGALVLPLTSCMTTYDSYGRPVQSVDPGVAVAGVAAAGLIGYAAANNRGHHDSHYRNSSYYGGHSYNRHYSHRPSHYYRHY